MSVGPRTPEAAAPTGQETAIGPVERRNGAATRARGFGDWLTSAGAVTRGEPVVAGLVLLALAAVLLGSHVIHGNFYYDDWTLNADRKYQGYWSTVSTYIHIDHRPLVALYLPLMSLVLGDNAHLQLGWVLFAHAGMCFCLFAFLRTAGLERLSAGTISVLALLFPFADASWLYMIGSAGTISVSTYLLGSIAALHGLRATGRRAALLHGIAVTLYVMSVLTYELALVAILVSVLLYAGRAPWRAVARRWAADLVAMGLTLLVTTRTVPVLPGKDVHNTLTLHQQLSHLKLIVRQARGIVAASLEPFGVTHYNIILAAAAVIVVIAALVAVRLPPGDPLRRDLRRWLWILILAACGTIAAWLVFVPADPYYSPAVAGVGNRINVFVGVCLSVGVFALAAVTATLILGALRRPRIWVPAGALVLSAVVAIGYAHRVDKDKSQWDLAAKLQRQYLATLHRSLPHPAANTRVLLFDTPAFAASGIPVFGAPWDFDGAVKLSYNDSTLDGYPVTAGVAPVSCTATAVVPVGGGYSPDQTAPYGSVAFADGRTGTVLAITSRAQCQRALRELPPGPLVL